MEDRIDGQKKLEAHVEHAIWENNVQQTELVNGRMAPTAESCSYDDGTITFAFTVQPWQANRVGHMHGGMICTAFDITIATLARFYAGESFAPTVSLDVKFIRPVKVGDTLLVTARAMSAGRRITQLTGEAHMRSSGKLAATAASVFLNIDTVRERRPAKK